MVRLLPLEMATKDTDFSVATYNCHGFNQGASLLNELCDKNKFSLDCICLQELWLTPTNLSQIRHFNKAYTFYGMSAMEKQLSIGVLRGRAHGGVGVLLKNSISRQVMLHEVSERFVILILENIIIISLYLPCAGALNRDDIICEVFENIKRIINPFPSHSIVCSGDYNDDLISNMNTLIGDFISDLDLLRNSVNSTVNSVNYTYVSESLNQCSVIDYILISKNLTTHL